MVQRIGEHHHIEGAVLERHVFGRGVEPGHRRIALVGRGGVVKRVLIDVDAGDGIGACRQDPGEAALAAADVERRLALERQKFAGDFLVARIAHLLRLGHSSSFPVLSRGVTARVAVPSDEACKIAD